MTAERDREIAEMLLADGLIDEAGTSLEWAAGKLSFDAEHPHDDITGRLALNFWDFGGQEVYRITHQFFFSTQAIYLLIWKPREGAEENSIAGWLHRIRIRVGSDVKVFLVARKSENPRPFPARVPLGAIGWPVRGTLCNDRHCPIDTFGADGIEYVHDDRWLLQ